MKINNPAQQINYPDQPMKNIHTNKEPEKLMEACRQFESIFINLMLKEMRKSIPDGGLTEKSYAREIYESMQDEKISVEMSKGQGIGLAQQLYKQLSSNLGITTSTTSTKNQK